MFLDLSDWSDRRAWFFGQYYQKALEQAIHRLLRQGDCYVDIGANIGMTALIAAKAIGTQGVGIAFEPNPIAFRRLQQHVQANRIDQIACRQVGIGEVAGTAKLYTGKHLGKASLLEHADESNTAWIEVQIQSGHQLEDDLPQNRPTLIKIDVEGYELNVLRAIETTLSRESVAVIVEVSDDRLQQVGGSAQELYGFMDQMGFEGLIYRLEQNRWSTRLIFDACSPEHASSRNHDVLFVRPADPIFSKRACS
jgi:FkbM family methyltransferase